MARAGIKILILTGMSGAGKSVVLRCLEDIGYYCIDNMLPLLIPKFVDLALQSEGKIRDVALLVDIREKKYFSDIFTVLKYLQDEKIDYQIVFLDARDEVLTRRYQETRRKHPLAEETGTVGEAVSLERELLEEIKGKADALIDTSDFSLPVIRTEVVKLFRPGRGVAALAVNLVSFGFKYGAPSELDLLFDVRFLPNPYYISRFKDLDGLDAAVAEYISSCPETANFMQRLTDFLEYLIPAYVKEGKSYLTIGIGCTGGRHRSVTLSEKLAHQLQELFPELEHHLEHRDIGKR